MSKIGILGGSFNPIHNGHIYIAREVRDKLSLDKIVFVPTGIAPHKNCEEFAPKYDRYNMVCIAAEDEFEVSDIEVKSDRICYAVDTVKILKEVYKSDEIFYIIGGDSLMTFMEWREPQKLFDMLHIVVVDRGRADIDKKADEFRKLYNAKITVCHIKPIDISSSKIRLNFKKTGTSGGLVPNNVEEYIISKKLYMEVKNGNRGN